VTQPTYLAQVDALIADFDRERTVTLLASQTGWTPRRFERMSDEKLQGWLVGEKTRAEVVQAWRAAA